MIFFNGVKILLYEGEGLRSQFLLEFHLSGSHSFCFEKVIEHKTCVLEDLS